MPRSCHQRSLMNFFDGISWLMQIGMFLTLGLVVFPQQIMAFSGSGRIIALVLIFLGRPLSVFISMTFSRFNGKAKLMISWIGLRGAVPIILATFPLVAGLAHAELFFSVIFFVVVTSVLVQGPTLPIIAKALNINATVGEKTRYPIELDSSIDTKAALKEVRYYAE